jgi:Holliday junction resolvase
MTGNPRYRGGYELERAVRKDYEARGWFVVRAGGSKGPADLVAIQPGQTDCFVDISVVELVQCKADGKITKTEAFNLSALAETLAATARVAFWVKEGRAARTVGYKEA